MGLYHTSEQLGGTQQALSTAYKTLVAVFATTGAVERGRVYDVTFGANGTYASTDTEVEYDISRMTADGTGTAVTPTILDPADAACRGTSKANYTAEPTVTANSSLLHISANQRATYRWVAAPGSELIFPATANNGLVHRAKGETSGYTGTASADVFFQE